MCPKENQSFNSPLPRSTDRGSFFIVLIARRCEALQGFYAASLGLFYKSAGPTSAVLLIAYKYLPVYNGIVWALP